MPDLMKARNALAERGECMIIQYFAFQDSLNWLCDKCPMEIAG
jgi:hypothetical protein